MVHDADGLTDAQMLAFARETRLSETTFVQAAASGADYRNRIWCMTGEMPLAGHPSLGTAVAVAVARGEDRAEYVQQTHAGRQPVRVERRSGTVMAASMLQEPVVFGPPVGAAALAALGLGPGDADPRLPVQVASTGLPHLLVPVAGPAVLGRCAPDPALLPALLADLGCATAYLAAVDVAAGLAQARAFFADPGGLSEDPGTGSAAGPLVALLQRELGVERVRIEQGVAMGRRSVVDAQIEGDRARVGGDVTILAHGTLTL